MQDTTLMALELGLQKRKQLAVNKLEQARITLENSKINDIQKQLAATFKHIQESPAVRAGSLLAQELLRIKEKKQKLDFLNQPYVKDFIKSNKGFRGKNVYLNQIENPLNFFVNVNVNEVENIWEYLIKENKEKSFESEIEEIRAQLDKNEGYFTLLRLNADLEVVKNHEKSSVELLRIEMLEHEIAGPDIQIQSLQEFKKIKAEGQQGEPSPVIRFRQPPPLPSLLEMINAPDPVEIEGLPTEIPNNNLNRPSPV